MTTWERQQFPASRPGVSVGAPASRPALGTSASGRLVKAALGYRCWISLGAPYHSLAGRSPAFPGPAGRPALRRPMFRRSDAHIPSALSTHHLAKAMAMYNRIHMENCRSLRIHPIRRAPEFEEFEPYRECGDKSTHSYGGAALQRFLLCLLLISSIAVEVCGQLLKRPPQG